MDEAVMARLATLDPRRKVDRSQYSDPTMPEHPGAVLTQHVAMRGMQVGSVLGCLAFAPVQWIRQGRKEALFKTVMPRIGATGLLLGGAASSCMLLGMAAYAPDDGSKPPWTDAGVDDRAYRLSKNEKVEKMNDMVVAGAVAGLVAGRSQASRGLFGHVAMGMAWSSLAFGFVYAGIPAIRKEWPGARKALEAQGVDLSFLDAEDKKKAK
uniref:Uncharacterized protein n=1 Tax=Hemiselmis tepida TaxID=464990 RepID=A0A7S0VKE4_9CRYP|eukprot:CAMPEP_0174926368 /NCGR_PEP_ID=MMETSP1355-20121228/11211_1 /TAXON_ID=464990 /ORGANISM="Hemiselmis tepida, Strain CCMP443" /LENGTH=209 /DNA_ID=CAMNT_0016172395 /DNA_START=35 /DNA_END=664 /DNA_ORIENTATION=-